MGFAEYKNLDLVEINRTVLDKWKAEQCFENTLKAREGAKKFVAFYFSDEAQKIMNDKTHMSLPFTFDNAANNPNIDTWSTFEKTMYTFSQKYTMVGMVEGRRSLVFTRGGAFDYAAVNFVRAMSQQ